MPNRSSFGLSVSFKRRRRVRRFLAVVTVLGIAAVAAWWYWPDAERDNTVPAPAMVADSHDDPTDDVATTPVDVAHAADARGLGAEVEQPQRTEIQGTPLLARRRESDTDDEKRKDAETLARNPAVARACRMYEAGQILEARTELNRLLHSGLSPSDETVVRRWLEKAAEETIFSSRQTENDPLVEAYHVEPGDVLVGISKRFRVPYEVLMRINGIRKAEGLRAGETIKVLRGPFHAKIFKSKFRLDVYLQDVYVRSFPVGLGGADSTPEGAWKVKNRQPNPTYYPPASAKVKRIIPADDPDNPLGEHWIGLDGVSSGALGKIGYGIHGTIAPESIGKAVSLGCVRMHNKDVEFLFGLLQIGHSTVTILP